MATKATQVEAALAGYVDDANNALASGKLYTYEAGTTTNKTTWQDQNKTTPHANPIILGSAGTKSIFADGLYKFVLKDSTDTLIRTYDNLQYLYFAGDVTETTTITALDSNGLTLKDDGGNTGITIKDGGNVGIKGDTNPQTAFGIADTDATAYSSTINVTAVGSDVLRLRNTNASSEFVSILSEVGSGNVGMSRLITRKESSNETSFYIQLRDDASSTLTTTQFSLTSEGLLTIGSQINVGNLTLTGNTLSSGSGDINITPVTGSDVVIDSHFEFDANLLTALTDVNTIITAYTGRNITIEDVTFDGGAVAGITTLAIGGALSGVTSITMTGAISGTTNISMSGTLDLGTNTISDGVLVGTWNFDSGTLYVDSANNRVGVNNASPVVTCDIISTTEQLRVGYDASNYYSTTVGATGAVTFNAVGAGSAFSFSDNVSITGTLSASGNFEINTNKFTVTASSGNTVVAGTLGVTGAATISNTIQINVGSSTPATLITGTVASFISSALTSTNSYLNLQSGNIGSSGITLGDSDNDDVASITLDNNTNILTFTNSSTSFYFNSSGNLGIGTSTISAKTHILATTEQLRIGYDASNYYSTTVGSTGAVTFNAVGSGSAFGFSDPITITPTNTSGGQLGINLVDTGGGGGEGLYINWDSTNRINMASIGAIGAATGGYLSFYTNSADSGSNSERLRISSTGQFSTNAETAPDCSAGGITFLCAGGSSNKTITLKDSNAAHGVTGVLETDTLLAIKQNLQTDITAIGAVGSSYAVRFNTVSAIPAPTTSGVFEINASIKSGTSTTGLAATDCMFSIANNTTTQFRVMGNGGIYCALTTQTFEMTDAGNVAATEQAWVTVKINGTTGYLRVYAAK